MWLLLALALLFSTQHELGFLTAALFLAAVQLCLPFAVIFFLTGQEGTGGTGERTEPSLSPNNDQKDDLLVLATFPKEDTEQNYTLPGVRGMFLISFSRTMPQRDDLSHIE